MELHKKFQEKFLKNKENLQQSGDPEGEKNLRQSYFRREVDLEYIKSCKNKHPKPKLPINKWDNKINSSQKKKRNRTKSIFKQPFTSLVIREATTKTTWRFHLRLTPIAMVTAETTGVG